MPFKILDLERHPWFQQVLQLTVGAICLWWEHASYLACCLVMITWLSTRWKALLILMLHAAAKAMHNQAMQQVKRFWRSNQMHLQLWPGSWDTSARRQNKCNTVVSASITTLHPVLVDQCLNPKDWCKSYERTMINRLHHYMTVLTSVCVIVYLNAYTQADWAASGVTHTTHRMQIHHMIMTDAVLEWHDWKRPSVLTFRQY